MMPVFAFTLLLSSSLLFFIQPMMGKLLLPLLGGGPQVWTLCMLFFQAVLLLGYAYAHWSLKLLGPKLQPLVHFVLLISAFLSLPFGLSESSMASIPSAHDPSLWILKTLIFAAGLPFFVVSASAPLLQRWFSFTEHPDREDPYFLYSASNAGSLLGLLCYPLLVEPLTTLKSQAELWTVSYGLLGLAFVVCGSFVLRSPRREETRRAKSTTIPFSRKFQWVALAFLPSSLMLGLTTYLTTDVAPTPLLWVIPLVIYLISFIFAFSRRGFRSSERGERVTRLGSLIALLFFLFNTPPLPIIAVFILNIALFTSWALIIHGKLAQLRPGPNELTEYFLFVSIGGVLGGIFNGLCAPLVFTNVTEYALVLALACLVTGASKPWIALHELRWPSFLLLIGLGVIGLERLFDMEKGGVLLFTLIFGFLILRLIEQVRAFSFSLLIMLFIGGHYIDFKQASIYQVRTFFGIVKVQDRSADQTRYLIDGNTAHGRESLVAQECVPLSYFHREGPMGAVFEKINPKRVGILGLGIGSHGCYAREHQAWDFFEINPAIAEVATNPELFRTYKLIPTENKRIILGDGRLQLARAPDDHYDLLVMDAFSSNAVPIHLLTKEAVELYLNKLTPDGVLIFNLSNRNLVLTPVLASIASALSLRGVVLQDDLVLNEGSREERSPSLWVVLTRDRLLLDRLATHPYSRKLGLGSRWYLWTDSYSNIVMTLKGVCTSCSDVVD
jgi:hypothetical protein